MRPLKLILVSMIFALGLSGCTTSLQMACNDLIAKKIDPPPTKEEKLAAIYGSCFRYSFMEKKPDGTWEFANDKFKTEDMYNAVVGIKKDLEDSLDWTKERNVEFIKRFGLRPFLEQQERKYQTKEYRLKTTLVYEKFRELMGIYTPDANGRDGGYQMRFIYPLFDLESEFKFVSPDVEKARQQGELALMGTFVWFLKEEYAKKEPDANFPGDPNKFIWRKRVRGIEWQAYKKINPNSQPVDNVINYVEGTRLDLVLDENGKTVGVKRESKPAVKIFTSLNGDNLDVLVADSDREGERGFGLPDLVNKIVGVRTVEDMHSLHERMFMDLFPEKPGKKRVEPKPLPEMIVEIARMGESNLDPWEKAANEQGWTVPIQYKNEKSDNYTVQVVFEKKAADDKSNLKQIKLIVKKWHAAGNRFQAGKGEVVEYYKPKSEFADKNVIDALIDWSNPKKLTISREGMPDVAAYVTSSGNLVINDSPTAIDFTDGEKRWRIRDKDGDGIFEGRKEIAKGEEKGKENGSPLPVNQAEYSEY